MDTVIEYMVYDKPTNEDIDIAADYIEEAIWGLRHLTTRENYDFMLQYVDKNKHKFDEEVLNLIDAAIYYNQLTPEDTTKEVDAKANVVGRKKGSELMSSGKTNTFLYVILMSIIQRENFTDIA